MFEELNARIAELTHHVRIDKAGQQNAVQLLVEDVREALRNQFGLVAAWEANELDDAAAYAASNWLMVALSAVSKALFVSQLPDEEYWGGLQYTKPTIQRSPRAV